MGKSNISVKDRDSGGKDHAESESKRANWDNAQDIAFINAVVEQTLAGNVTQNGYTKPAWASIQREFKEKTSCNYDTTQLRNRLNILKGHYKIAKELRYNASGFGWDPTNFVFTAKEDVWADYIKAHQGSEYFKKSSFPVFDDLAFICDGKVAEGKFAKLNQQKNQGKHPLEILEDQQEEMIGDGMPSQHEEAIERDESMQSHDESSARESVKARQTSISSLRSKRKKTNVSELSEAVSELASAHRFRASYFKSKDDPFGLNKCIEELEALGGIMEDEIFAAIKLFKDEHAREAFMSLKPHRRLNWLRSEL